MRRILTLESVGDDVFRGESNIAAPRIYGGQALGQSLAAAGLTVDSDRQAHSLHGHFIHPGRSDIPVEYHVERLRDGGSFTTRHVRAVQGDRTIFVATASFQRPETGLEHQQPMSEPAIPPEQLPQFEDSMSTLELGEAGWLLRFCPTSGWSSASPRSIHDWRIAEARFAHLGNARGFALLSHSVTTH